MSANNRKPLPPLSLSSISRSSIIRLTACNRKRSPSSWFIDTRSTRDHSLIYLFLLPPLFPADTNWNYDSEIEKEKSIPPRWKNRREHSSRGPRDAGSMDRMIHTVCPRGWLRDSLVLERRSNGVDCPKWTSRAVHQRTATRAGYASSHSSLTLRRPEPAHTQLSNIRGNPDGHRPARIRPVSPPCGPPLRLLPRPRASSSGGGCLPSTLRAWWLATLHHTIDIAQDSPCLRSCLSLSRVPGKTKQRGKCQLAGTRVFPFSAFLPQREREKEILIVEEDGRCLFSHSRGR